MDKKPGRLNERQRRFAELYLQLGNAAEAAEQAGYCRSYAQTAKKQPAVQAYMKDRLKDMQEKDVASADEVLRFLTDVMRGKYEGIEPGRNASPRMKAAELLGKRLGVFREVSDILQGGVPCVIDDIPDGAAAD